MATAPFLSQCDLVVSNNYDTVGSLTKAKLYPMTDSQIINLFKTGTTWYETSAFLKTQFEMQACGLRRHGLFDWIMSSNRPGQSKLINVVRRDKGPSLVQPFIMGRQQSVVNTDYWTIYHGWAYDTSYAHADNPAIGSTTEGPIDLSAYAGETTGDRIIRVILGYGVAGGSSGFSYDEKWFLAGDRIYLLNLSSGAASVGQWRVLTSAVNTDRTYIDILIRHEGLDTTGIDQTPTNGIVLSGINNVNDVEKYCLNAANYNPTKHVPFWYQTRRRARRVDSIYLEVFAKLMEDNAYFAEFGDLPLAERNRQDEDRWRRQFIHAFFFNREISSNQTLTLWGSLDAIKSAWDPTLATYNAESQVAPSVTTGLVGSTITYRANFVGVYWQLKACARVIDLQNQPLNIVEFLDIIYEVSKARKSRGKPGDSIDAYTDAETAQVVLVGLINYYKAVFGDILRINITPGGNTWGFTWNSIALLGKATGITLNLIVEETFNDMVAAFQYAEENYSDKGFTARGRQILILDMGKGGTIYPAMLASNRKVHKLGDIENLAKIDSTYACIMEAPTEEITLTSETLTAIVEDPKSSLWICGISNTTPVTTGRVSPYTDLV